MREEERGVEAAGVPAARPPGAVPGRRGTDLRAPAQAVVVLGLAGRNQAAVGPEEEVGLAALSLVDHGPSGVNGSPVEAVRGGEPEDLLVRGLRGEGASP